MDTLNLRVGYRPVRFGWCVREGNLQDLRKVLRLTHTLWGGRYNPIISVAANNDVADQLIELFNVDALYPAAEDHQVNAFIARFPYLPWPEFEKQLFLDGMRGKIATFLDIYHPVRHLFEEFIKDKAAPQITAKLFEWNPADPLSDVLLAMFGSYPAAGEIGKDYGDFVTKNLKAERVKIELETPVPHEVYGVVTPTGICSHQLEWHRPNRGDPGIYSGDAASFSDIVNFWNLRAADIELIFYDASHDARLRVLKNSWVAKLNQRPEDPAGFRNAVAVWQEGNKPLADIDFGPSVLQCTVTAATWNGLNVRPPLMHIEDEQSVLASVSSSAQEPSANFQLPKKPFYAEREFHNQHMIVTVHPYGVLTDSDERSFHFPFVPEVNEYYGREAYFRWNAARSQRDGLAIVTEVTSNDLHIKALSARQTITKMFKAFGISATPSTPGLIAGRLVRQMGGIQGCRVFKIRGVRELIEKYSPLQPFTRSAAIQTIGQNDPVTHLPQFQDYENLYIEWRERGKLKPEDAFSYLLKNGVFRVGLNLKCPNCELHFWLSLDDLATQTECEYCGKKFDIAPQLRDRDWAYRRSGLFGKEDHQEGSIPVALTLQQIDTVLSTEHIFTTGMTLTPTTAAINGCETDFVIVDEGYGDKVQLAIGEAKTRKEITAQDVDNLRRVADALQGKRFATYIIFAKTTSFTQEEVARCRVAQSPYRRRVILLSARELEPYFVYERTAKEFEVPSAISLERLAQATHNIYFEPKIKAAPAKAN